jgi:hypothetical protein
VPLSPIRQDGLVNDYDGFPNHPLNGVPDAVLQVAREVTAEAVRCKDVDPDIADALADAVISAALPALKAWLSNPQ